VARPIRIALVVAGLAALAFIVLVAAAWFLMPKDWIDREAKRQAAQIKGATVRWDRLEPGFTWLAVGVRIKGLYVRVPEEMAGEAELEARVREIFVSFQLLPLLSRRVELSAARVSGAGVAMTERRAPVDSAAASPGRSQSAAGVALLLPRLDLEDVDIRTRDLSGGGVDVRRLSGRAEVDGTIGQPRGVRIGAKAESLLWKPSARGASLLLPSPLRIDVVAKGDEAGRRLTVERGAVDLGPLESALTGEVRFHQDGSAPELALSLTGKPQPIRSDADAFRALASAWPASWSTNASWEIRIEGPATAPVQTGRLTMKPVTVTSGASTFSLAQAAATWTVKPDRTYKARVEAADQGLEFSVGLGGSTLPGGATSGTWNARAKAVRLNGLMPHAPTWRDGTVESRGVFTVEPPALPSLGWTATGTGLSGDVPGLTRPVSGMTFDVRGDDRVISIRSFQATVGSTTASLTGTMLPGKPLGTGTFRASLDRFVAEEWAPPPGSGAAAAAKAAAPPASAPPIPLRSFDAMVTIGELRSGQLTVRDVVVPVKYAEGNLDAAPITGRIGTGSVAGGLALKDLTSKPSYALNLNIKRAPVEEFAAGLLPFQLGLTGLASGAVDLAGPGMPGPAVSDSLRGSLTGTVEEGKILETPAIAGLRNALGLGPGADSGGDLAFKTLTHSLRIDRGRLLLDKVKGDVGKDLFEMTGSMGFDKSLNVDLLLRLAPERIKGGTALAQFARYARDKDGRLPVTVKVTGTALAPKVSIKPGKTLDIAGERIREEITRSLTEGGKRDSSRSDSAAAVDPLQKGREALKRLLGK
jgi:hypothetical protein